MLSLYPATSEAVTVSVRAWRLSPATNPPTTPTETLLTLSCTTLATVNTAGNGVLAAVQGSPGASFTCSYLAGAGFGAGSFQIVPQPGAASGKAEIAAVPGVTQNQLVMRTSLVKNLSATNRIKIELNASHQFTLTSPYTVFSDRYYGYGYNASFSRNGGLSLASQDKIEKSGFYQYVLTSGALSREDRIGGNNNGGTTLSYEVPLSGATTANTIPTPSPQAKENVVGVRPCPDPVGKGCPRVCADLVTSGTCDGTKERLRTLITLTLGPSDTVTIPNGVHDYAGGDFATPDPKNPKKFIFQEGTGGEFLQATLDLLTAQLVMLQNTPVMTVNPFDQGHVTIILVGNDQFHPENVVTDGTFPLVFGRGAASPESTELKDVTGPNGVKDGVLDLVMSFRTPEVEFACGDTTATLSGVYDYPDLGFLEFHSTIGFATVSNQCP